MIPFASQRGEGQDLAVHLSNGTDNEYVEIADIRGAMAGDLHGAFAEWEAQARAMTKCENYLYSLSINPDPAQGPMARGLYEDYIARVETALGLEGQGRAVVFHIKEDRQGIPREHCHVVWSRIDVQDMKAIHMAFDYDKLMAVSRQFARDHNMELPPGYHKLEDRKRQTYRQLSLYDKAQQEATGITREERAALVTELWQARDTPAAFVKALEYHGYILARGKRPYVLVDIDGNMNALPKLIDDPAVKTKHIRDFLGSAYDESNLPPVEEARAEAAKHRRALKDFKKSQAQADRIDQLREIQARRREKLQREINTQADRHKQNRLALESRQRDERRALRSAYLEEKHAIRRQRHEMRPRGLAGFLARVSGVELARRKLYKYRDKKRYEAFLSEKHEMRARQVAKQQELQRRQEMQALDLERKRRALDQTEKRERKSLETSFQCQQSIRRRAGREHGPMPGLDLKPRGRKAVPHKAKNRHTSELGRELRKTREPRAPDPKPAQDTLQDHFARAVKGDPVYRESAGGKSPGSTGPNPSPDFKPDGPSKGRRR